MKSQIQELIRANRNGRAFSGVALLCSKYLHAWHNEGNFNFDQNGEEFALQCYKRWKQGSAAYTIWDVGAHKGEWAREAVAILGDQPIISFEILPWLASALQTSPASSKHVVFPVGLSSTDGKVEVTWNRSYSSTSSMRPRLSSEWYSTSNIETSLADVRGIDSLISEGMDPPSLIKIDVEGNEAAVLEGGRDLLMSASAPEIIQFEYGDTWIPFGKMLFDTHRFLKSCGYYIGRLYPEHVEFKEYCLDDEHFRMGNYICVKDPSLKLLLEGTNRQVATQ